MAHNVKAEVKGDQLILTIDVSKASFESAPASSTGKMHLVGTTSGYIGQSGPGGMFKFSLNVGR